jgi:hypothetical protein
MLTNYKNYTLFVNKNEERHYFSLKIHRKITTGFNISPKSGYFHGYSQENNLSGK